MDNPLVLDIFHPIIKEWFQKHIGEPSPPQVEGWPAIQRGENVLIAAPTGAGKTLSAFLECINRLFVLGLEGKLEDGVQVLYISPLKALNNDIYRNLEVPLEGIREICREKGVLFPAITRAVRTGDTPAGERQRMKRKPPHILITTPESLYLMLTAEGSRGMLRSVKYLIVDEIHSLLGNKRGVHLALSIARLSHLIGRPITRIGLSATVKPIEEAARYLGGYEKKNGEWAPRKVTVIQPAMGKVFDLKVHMPVKDFRVLDEGTIWPEIYREVLGFIREHTSTLVFVNNRAVAEKVAANLNFLADSVVARTHHGSISRESRLEVEQQLKSGELPCLVATSSLELGIDVGAIDLVIQIASPKSVARGLQRLGRAGHRMHAVSKGRVVPRTRGDLLESAIISREMLQGGIEEERVPANSLDILAQQLVAMACNGRWTLQEIQDVVMEAYSYQGLKQTELEKVLAMLSGDYEHQEDTPVKPRVLWDRVNKVMRGNTYSRMLAISGNGTIPDRGYYGVYLEDGVTRLGELDEVFVFEARIGERFMLGTSSWRIRKIERDRVIVSPGSNIGAKTPFWTGDGLGRPYELGLRFGEFLRELSERVNTPGYLPWILSGFPLDEAGALNLEEYILEQKRVTACLPHDRRIVVEYFSDEVGERRIVVHSLFGGRINGGLAILLEHALSVTLGSQVETSHNDDGVLIHIMEYPEHPRKILSLLSSCNVEEVLIQKLPTTPLFAMTFRYCVNRALMLGMKSRGRRVPLWMQRLRGLEALQVAEKYIDHPLIIETFRECMETILDVPNLKKLLKSLESGSIEVYECITPHPSPFTSELLFKFKGVMMYEGQVPDPKEPNQKIVSGREALQLRYLPEPGEALPGIEAMEMQGVVIDPRHLWSGVKSVDELHGLFLTYGDMRVNDQFLAEASALCPENPKTWLEALVQENRIVHAGEVGLQNELWFASEEYPLYAAAYALPDQKLSVGVEQIGLAGREAPWTREEAMSRIIRRFARYNSPFCKEDILERYSFPEENVKKVLDRLTEDGVLVKGAFRCPDREEWCHTVIYDRVRKRSLKHAREAVETRKASVMAAFLPIWQKLDREAVPPAEALYDAIVQLRGLYLPVEWWEDFVFPARVSGYQKALLDKICATGRAVWRVKPGEGTPRLAWFIMEDMEENFEDSLEEHTEGNNLLLDAGMEEGERKVYDVLKRRGACFFHVLSAATRLGRQELLEALETLVWRGIVVNDSFESIRYFLANYQPAARRRAGRNSLGTRMEMGRWEIAAPIPPRGMEKQLEIWFNRYGLLTKEAIQLEEGEWTWTEVYEVLKQWEYIGKVNRGYYIEGLSGIQFILPAAAQRLSEPTAGYRVLNACDPAQVYGRMASHIEGEYAWSCIPGTAVVLKDGEPVVLLERYGERIVPVSPMEEEVCEGMRAFAEAFCTGRIWRNRKKVKVKLWNEQPLHRSPILGELNYMGFEREAGDLVLWRNVL